MLLACMPKLYVPTEARTDWDMECCDPFEVPSLEDVSDWQKTVKVLVEGGADLMESDPV